MSHVPSIHDAYGGFGDRPDNEQPSTNTIMPPPPKKKSKNNVDETRDND